MRIRRIVDIAKVFADEGLGYILGSEVLETGTESTAEKPSAGPNAETAIRLRRTFERLGPTFVKFGQLLATRVDLFPDEFLKELSKLHSSVTPFPTDVAMQRIEQELARPVREVFSEFGETPVAAASIAQVYQGRLLQNGQLVAIKIQRPDLEQSLLQDLDLLLQLSGWLDALLPAYHQSMMHLVAKEYALRSRIEIQFLSEAAALERFGEIMEHDPYFSVPRVYRELSTDTMIVMEWFDGRKLDEIDGRDGLRKAGFDPGTLAHNLARLQLTMSYEHGFVHADTHPGNIMLLRNGKVGLIDFGLYASVSKKTQHKMLEVLLFESQGRFEEEAAALVDFSPPANPKDIEAYKADLKAMLEAPGPSTGPALSRRLIAFMRIGAKYRNRANTELLMIVRNLAILEGINLKICPEFDHDKAMADILRGILGRRMSLKTLAQTFQGLIGEIALTLSHRPELLTRLMKTERNFANSKDLADFLRKEGIETSTPRPPYPYGWVVAAFLAGALFAATAALVGAHFF